MIQMESHFGARLRQRRELQELTLDSIADQTKIKASLLEALERDDLSHWPPGIYRRAYVRAYATAIGLDADTVVREFLEAYPEPVEVVETPPTPTGLRGLVGSALGSLSRIRHAGLAQPPADLSKAPVRPPAQFEKRLEDLEEVVEQPNETTVVIPPPSLPERPAAELIPQVDFLAAARVCTELGRAETAVQVQPLLGQAAAILGAQGLIVWVWDSIAMQLRAVLGHGYSDQVMAQLPGVGRDEDNLTAAAFRSRETLAVSGTSTTSGALALPLLTPAACAGVLTIELPPGNPGSTESGDIRAAAIFVAAMVAQLVGGGAPAAAEPVEHLAETPPIAS